MLALNSRRSISICAAMFLAASLAGCEANSQAAAAAAPPPPVVEVANVQTQAVMLWGSFTGRVAAPESVEIRPRVSGYIERIEFVEGELVKQGDVLIVIDQRQYHARERLAAAELERAQSLFDLASSEAARATELRKSRAISDEELDRRIAAEATAKAALNAASAALQSAQLELEYTEIKSPISGRIGRAQLTRGNLASADVSLLTTVVSVDPLHVYFESDQHTAQTNPNGLQEARVPVRIRAEGDAAEPLVGELDFIDNRYNSRTGTLQYRATVPNPDARLRPGQFARVDMPITATQETLLVDQKAVLTDQDRRFVYVLDDADKTVKRYVETGHRFNGLLVVEDGLQPGDRVIVNGLQKIAFPGMQVTPQAVQMRRESSTPLLAERAAL